jgi:hypothetical protein
MGKRFRNRTGVILATVAALFWSASASAYIPPSLFLIKTWMQKHSKVKHLRIRNTIIAFEKDQPTNIRFSETAIFNSKTSDVKSWATDEAGKTLFSNQKKFSALPPVAQLLIGNDFKEVSQSLKAKGIPVRLEADLLALKTESERINSESQSLGRWQGKIAWVIGPTGSNLAVDSGPQLWFEKDTFLPIRLIYTPSAEPEDSYEFQFDQYRLSYEFPYPKSIQVFKKGKGHIFTVQLTDVSVNSDKLETLNPTGEAQSSPSALKELVQLYYELFR